MLMWIVCRDGSEPQGGKAQAVASPKKRHRPLNTQHSRVKRGWRERRIE